MKRVAGLLIWLFASVSALGVLVEENVERPLSRFFAWALGLGVLLILIAPVGRGDGVDPIPNLYVAVGIAALFAVVDRLTTSKRLTRWAEDYRRRHPAS